MTPGADVDTLAIYEPKYFDLEHCSCKQPVWRGDKQIALVKQIKHWQHGSPRHLTLSPHCPHCVSVPETFPEFVTRGHHHISHHIDFRAPQPFSQSQANFYYILSNTGSTPAAKHVSVSKSSLSLSCGIGMENWVSGGKN